MAVWEWFLFPVGFALYFFTFFFYWVFRRLRRVFFEKEANRYHHQCFVPNRTFLEFLLVYKSEKTCKFEAKMEKTQVEQMRRCQIEASRDLERELVGEQWQPPTVWQVLLQQNLLSNN